MSKKYFKLLSKMIRLAKTRGDEVEAARLIERGVGHGVPAHLWP